MSLVNDCLRNLRQPRTPVRTGRTPRISGPGQGVMRVWVRLTAVLAAIAVVSLAGTLLLWPDGAWLLGLESPGATPSSPAPQLGIAHLPSVPAMPPDSAVSAQTPELVSPPEARPVAPVNSSGQEASVRPDPVPVVPSARIARASDSPEAHFEAVAKRNAKALEIESRLQVAWTAGDIAGLERNATELLRLLGEHSPAVRKWRGLAEIAAGRYEDAEKAFDLLVRQYPEDALVRAARIHCLRRLGREADVREAEVGYLRDFGSVSVWWRP